MLPAWPLLITYGLLALAILSAWSERAFRFGAYVLRPWAPLFAAAAACAMINGYVHPLGVMLLLVLGWLGRALQRDGGSRARRAATWIALLVLSAALAAHVAPGFSNPVLLRDHLFSADAAPYTQYANFDKGAMGLLLLVFFCGPLMRRDAWRSMLVRAVPVLLSTCTVVIVCGLLLGYSRVDPKWPAYTPIFLFLNLFFTCVAEEALFRGVVQQRLGQLLEAARYRHAGAVSLVATAVLFGLVHTGGGWGYVLLATLAGLGYGYALLRTGRIEAAILVHFSVNATHFIGFTYPRLA